ncbi:aquaporin [Streptomyces sp. NPDC046876]|uniref:MIP/aquaporin family protein n=1 Tax=Streptomyces sp. NPDC046876 TaxID=3155616 RepID=UPI00340F93BF
MDTNTDADLDTGPGPAPVQAAPAEFRGHPLYEFALTATLMFSVVTAVRWVLDPTSPLATAHLNLGLTLVGAVAGALVFGLIRSPWGRRSGAHMNPAVTFALWLLRAFPGRGVAVYAAAQLGGSVAGTALARLAWGPAVARVNYAAVAAAPSWNGWAVFAAEGGSLLVVTLLIGFFLAHPVHDRWLPCALGMLVWAIVALLGPYSGGAANPARQFGPALVSGSTAALWIYLAAPLVGAALGAAAHRLLQRSRPYTRRSRRDPASGRST